MKNFILPYGLSQVQLALPDTLDIEYIAPQSIPPAENPEELIRSALRHPLGDVSLADYSNAHSVAIAINDKTRPVPHELLLPVLLEELLALGIQPTAIQFFIATGTHVPMKSEEFNKVVPEEILQKFRVVSHDTDDAGNLKFLGTTRKGTPVWVNKKYYEAELKIVVGNIEPHHFMGFSGGAKTAAIGLTGRETINHNHTFLVDPNSMIGEYQHNPTRQDMEEIGQLIQVQFALNVVMNAERQIVKAIAGTPVEVMHAGIPLARKICQTHIHRKFDLTIASAGGYPKDINLYQAQKALTNASLITKDEGTVILVAACAEGPGSASYEEFMQGLSTWQEVYQKFQEEGFRVGPHKAFMIARELKRIKIILVSEIPSAKVKSLLLTPADTIQKAFEMVSGSIWPESCIAILPKATNTVPM
jgi:nickel-dependent lactate racemase